MKTITYLCVLLCAWGVSAQPMLRFDPIDSTFYKPIGLISRGDGSDEIYVLGKDGPIHRYDLNSQDKVMFLDLSDVVETQGEAGLLGATFHSNPDSNYFYILHTVPGPSRQLAATLQVSRFTLTDDGLADPDSEQLIISIHKPGYNQSGGGLEFGPDGYLYIGTGDGGGRFDPHENAQNPLSLLGKILRIDVDRQQSGHRYAIPPDNPFVGTPDTLGEIWSLGLRNPFRFSFDARTGDFWISDKANSFWQEINFQAAGNPGGQNYGWNCQEGFEESVPSSPRYCGDKRRAYDTPRLMYGRSGDTDFVGGSITGGAVYYGPEASLEGKYIFGDFYGHRLFVFTPGVKSADSIRVITNTPIDNLTTLGTSNDGSLYAVDYSGSVYRVETEVTSTTRRQSPERLGIYPNPAQGYANVQWPGTVTTGLTATLRSSEGRVLRVYNELIPGAEGVVRLQLPEVPPGMYVVTLWGVDEVGSGRLLVH